MIICPVCLHVYDNARIPVICCEQEALHPFGKVDPSKITDKTQEAVETAVGYAACGWDMVDPLELIAAILDCVIQKRKEEVRDSNAD